MRPRAPFAILFSSLSIGAACGDESTGEPPLPPVEDPIPYVDPFIGSGGFGFGFGSAFPGAAAPHGLAKVGPDTSGPFGTVSFLHYSGYWYGDDTIQGFSHLHLHGTGLADYGVLALMPKDRFDPSMIVAEEYESRFAKGTEIASPGYYAVTLDDGGVRVEIAATPHAAHHRYTYPAGSARAFVIVDLAKHLAGGTVDDAELVIDPAARAISGRLHHVGGMSGGFGGYDVHFAIRARREWTAQEVWSAGSPPAPGITASGTDVGAVLVFDVSDGAPVELQVGVSLVDGAGALANLDAELPAFEFDATRAATEDAWRALLARILVEGGTHAERRMFYSSIYRAFLMPTQISDVDGRFRAMDGSIAQADGFRYVSDLSLWDTYRTLHPLYAWVARESALDSVRSLVEMARASGAFPRWPIATGESGTMVGASAEIVIADAYVKGVRDFDASWAYETMRAAAMDPIAPPGGRGGRGDVEAYIANGGWLPSTVSRSVGKTTEFSHDDFALAELAAALGDDTTAAALRDRRLGYRELYDPAFGFLRARAPDGSFPAGDFDPLELREEYVEANAWHSLWAAPHDVDGLVQLLGGTQPFVDRLSLFFEQAALDWAEGGADDTAKQSSPRPYYWHGNETDLHAAYLFAQAGRPDLTQKWVRWILDELYSDGPEGIPGNDDGGTMSAWYVFSALGFYPIAGTATYVVGTPLFTRARVETAGGVLTIEAPDAGEKIHVARVTVNGVALEGPSIDHAALSTGTIVFELSETPR